MKTKTTFIVTTVAITLLQFVLLASSSFAQGLDLGAAALKPGLAVLPKVVLMGAVAEAKGKMQYHKIILQVTNRDAMSDQMFVLPAQLPPNPCKRSRTRVVAAVYDERGPVVSYCMPIRSRDDLRELAFLIEKGKAIPKYVYVVLTDLKTTASYKSNYVSPSSGATK